MFHLFQRGDLHNRRYFRLEIEIRKLKLAVVVYIALG